MPRRPGDSAPRRRCAGRPRVPVARSRLSRSVFFLTTSINRSDHNDGHNMTKTRRTAWKSDDHHDNAPIKVVMPDVGHICGHWGFGCFPVCVQALTERHFLRMTAEV